MRKNRHLSKAISEQRFYEFKRQIQYKSEYYGIEFVKVPPFYPSSKTCSHCGGIKNDLKLSYPIEKDLSYLKSALRKNIPLDYLVSRGEYLTAAPVISLPPLAIIRT